MWRDPDWKLVGRNEKVQRARLDVADVRPVKIVLVEREKLNEVRVGVEQRDLDVVNLLLEALGLLLRADLIYFLVCCALMLLSIRVAARRPARFP